MFGKPQWFVPKRVGWGLHPVTWQGWVYTLVWVGILAAPFIALVVRHQFLEAGVWLVASGAALVYDVRLIRHQIQNGLSPKAKPAAVEAGKTSTDVLYIGDDAEPIATRNFQLRRKV